MKTYYYLDSLEDSSDILYYKIKSDLSYDNLINFFHKKATNFLDEIGVELEDFLSYNTDQQSESYLEIPFNGIHYFFSLYSCLDKEVLKTKLKTKIHTPFIEVKSEDVI